MPRKQTTLARIAVLVALSALPASAAPAGALRGGEGAWDDAVDVTVYIIAERPAGRDPSRRIPSRVHGAGLTGTGEISLDVRQRPVADAVREIGRQLGFGVVFDEAGERLARRAVSARVAHGSGLGVLDVLLEDNGLEAQVMGRVLAVSPAP